MKYLADVMNGEFANAKVSLRAVAGLQWIMAITATYAVVTNSSNAVGVAMVAFLGPLVILFCREVGTHYYAKGDRVRRLYMLQRGLGIEPSETDLLDIFAHGARRSALEAKPIGDYYSNDQAAGTPRLLLQLEESSFWTAALARRTAFIHYAISGIGTTAALLVALAALRDRMPGGTATVVDFSKLFSSLLLFFVSGTTMTSARSYHSLANGAAKVTERAANLRRSPDVESIELYKVLSLYDSSLSKALPIPGYVHRMMQKRLQASWDAAQGRKTGEKRP